MSLRDQLLKKGLVSKKQAREANRELRKARKHRQGARQKKKTLEAEEQAAAAARAAETLEQRRQRRLEREEAKAQVERALRIRHLVWGNRVRVAGKQPFWHRSATDGLLLRMEVSLRAAEQLRRGELAIAAFDHGTRVEYVVIRSEAAHTLKQLGASCVVFLVEDRKGILEPDEAFLSRTWDTDLRPRRHRLPTERLEGGAGGR